MDITEDSNTNSKNKLTLAGGNSHYEETMQSNESIHRTGGDQNDNGGLQSYSLFYGVNGGPSTGSELTTLGRFGSKKNLQKTLQNKHDTISPYSTNNLVSQAATAKE